MKLDWINSAGGPLVCASYVTAEAWQGVAGSSIGDVRSDYDRACEQFDYVGVVRCDSSEVLILGDEPMQSAFFLSSEKVFIARWVACESKEAAAIALATLPANLPSIEEATLFRLDSLGLVMFDAAEYTTSSACSSHINLPPGTYAVSTKEYKHQGRFHFLVHELQPVEGKIS
ncbi:MAG: hypothetical protein DWQ11_04535 [Proteobacteria bacterium]|nr:MAG: hypothetical protein DWQ11_04535 [Pseudomonadota bacterium]